MNNRRFLTLKSYADDTMLLLGSITTIKMHFRDRDLSFAFMKQNFVIDNCLPPITKTNWPLTFLSLIPKKKLHEVSPGSTCYNFHILKHIMQTKRATFIIHPVRQYEYLFVYKSVKVLKFVLTFKS